jgi:hypothetical protein
MAGVAVVAGVLVTTLSDRTPHLPGIALESKSLFLIERGGAVVVVLIVIVGLVARTLNRELPTGFSATTGSVTYADKVENATASSDEALAELKARLDELSANELTQDEIISALSDAVDKIVAAVQSEQGGQGPNLPGT